MAAFTKQAYAGDVSALCLLTWPPSRHEVTPSATAAAEGTSGGRSKPPAQSLLAGIGAQLLLFDVLSGALQRSLHVFDGVRIHGIICPHEPPPGYGSPFHESGGAGAAGGEEGLPVPREDEAEEVEPALPANLERGTGADPFTLQGGVSGSGLSGSQQQQQQQKEEEEVVVVGVHGERRVKVLGLSRGREQGGSAAGAGTGFRTSVSVLQALPRFAQWVLDIAFLEDDSDKWQRGGRQSLLAVGLSDNSVRIISWRQPVTLLQVSCSGK
eukprot:jgi/Mesen1/9207/ME000591S08527